MTCDPLELIKLAKCFACLDANQREAVKTYLLAVRAGGSTDPNTLLGQARCFTCLNSYQLQQIQAYLLCKILP